MRLKIIYFNVMSAPSDDIYATRARARRDELARVRPSRASR